VAARNAQRLGGKDSLSTGIDFTFALARPMLRGVGGEMKRRSSSRGGCLLAVGVLVAAAPSFAIGGPWVEVRSPHFVVVSDAGAGEARRIAAHFERIRAAFKALWPWARVDPAIPVMILAARDEQGLKVLLPGYWETKGRMHPAGVFHRGLVRPWIALRADLTEPPPGSDNPYSLIQHEYAHLVVSLNFERVPPWLNEGVAELLGGTTVRGNGVALGRPIVSHVHLLRDRRLLPVETLFVVDHRSPEYSEEKRAGLFYAESWAVVHYLMLDPKASHDPRFKGFVAKVVEGMEPSAALRSQGIKAAELDRTLESYVRQLTFWQATLATPIESGGDFPTREISSAEWSAVCGAFLVDSGRMAEGRRLLEQAEKQQSELAPIQEALGVALYREGRIDEARERLERAARLDPARPTAHVLVALVTQQAATVEARRAVRSHLEKALELAPEHALAHALLADLLLADEQAQPALEHALRAASLEPGSGSYRVSLALALAAAGRAAEAEAQAQKALDLGVDNAHVTAARELLQTLPALAGKTAEPSAPAPPPLATAPSGQSVAWGVFVNEDGAARVTAQDNRIAIQSAAGAYDLSAEIDNVNAPRLLRPVEGDCVAQVTVTRPPRPSASRASARRVAFNGAGLLLWQDDRNYVRLEFAAYVGGTGTVRYALFEQRKNGQPVGGLAQADKRLEDGPAALRLERHDHTLSAFVRQGGKDWTPIGEFREDLAPKLYVGLAAVNSTQALFLAEFEDFTIFPPP
jgi:tetratricopeptide (TPR) repeat protein